MTRVNSRKEESEIPGISMPSQEELESRPRKDFGGLLPEEEYIYEVKEIVVQPNQRNPYNGEVRDTLQVKLRPISFADKSPVVDEEGNDVPEDKLVWDFIDPTKIGMKPQPSKARKFFTAALRLPVGSGFKVDDYSDLIGVRLIGMTTIQEAYGDRPRQNKITSYRAIPTRPARRAAPVEGEADDEVDAPAPKTLPGEKVRKSTKPVEPDLDEDEDF